MDDQGTTEEVVEDAGTFHRYAAVVTVQYKDAGESVSGPQRETYAEAIADLAVCKAQIQQMPVSWHVWADRQTVAAGVHEITYVSAFAH